MPLNANPWVTQLLSWHGHAAGGVRVPFSPRGGNPLRDDAGKPLTIETRLIARLRVLAAQVARGEVSPRWVFLVGGPGNGKSEAVQEFILALDRELALSGSLETIVRNRLRPDPVVPCVVDVAAVDVAAASFSERVGRLIIIQDASAGERPASDAAEELVSRLVDLLTSKSTEGVLICCINRGLLARALAVTYGVWSGDTELVQLLKTLIGATALGSEALREERPTSWPLGLPAEHPLSGKVACWPLDIDSLLLTGGDGHSPIEQAIAHATREDRWEAVGACGDCDDRDLCPFRQNAAWLRAEPERRHLATILRRAELATSQRWNFRDSFSLVAELTVGDWADAQSADDPCAWVHGLAPQCRDPDSDSSAAADAALRLLARLYPNALFPGQIVGGMSPPDRDLAARSGCDRTLALAEALTPSERGSTTHIRTFLRDSVCPRLDPAMHSPHSAQDPVGALEDAYSQSVFQGNGAWPDSAPMAEIERVVCDLARKAEEEWNPLSRESAQVLDALRFLRGAISCIAKRSVGTRLGFHRDMEYLVAYEAAIRDRDALDLLWEGLRSLLGKDGLFRFNAVESFGQPQSEEQWRVILEDTVEIAPIEPAPEPTAEQPAHDLPCIRVSGHAVPLTFELYTALQLRGEGCASSSLPASVRAALDRIRHLYAGALCRDVDKFVLGRAKYLVVGEGQVAVTRKDAPPTFRARK
jgi:hypothetical protein